LPDGKLLVSDSSNHSIRAVTAKDVTKFAGLILGQDEANRPYGGYNDAELNKAAFDKPSSPSMPKGTST